MRMRHCHCSLATEHCDASVTCVRPGSETTQQLATPRTYMHMHTTCVVTVMPMVTEHGHVYAHAPWSCLWSCSSLFYVHTCTRRDSRTEILHSPWSTFDCEALYCGVRAVGAVDNLQLVPRRLRRTVPVLRPEAIARVDRVLQDHMLSLIHI